MGKCVAQKAGSGREHSRRGGQLHHSAIRWLVEPLGGIEAVPYALRELAFDAPDQSFRMHGACAQTFYSPSPLSIQCAISKAGPRPAERSPGLRPRRLAWGIPHFPPQLISAATLALTPVALHSLN